MTAKTIDRRPKTAGLRRNPSPVTMPGMTDSRRLFGVTLLGKGAGMRIRFWIVLAALALIWMPLAVAQNAERPTKRVGPEEALGGLTVLEPALADTISPHRTRTVTPPTGHLTPRELQVLQLLAEGLANKAIAHQLDISEHTVKFHVNSILSKLNAQSRTEAVMQATRLGLIPL